MDDQPTPVPRPELTPVWELVIADLKDRSFQLNLPLQLARAILDDMRERDQLGRDRYGVPLTAGNGRNHLVDAYQEALDAAVYLRADVAEGGTDTAVAYDRALRLVMQIRMLLEQRGGK